MNEQTTTVGTVVSISPFALMGMMNNPGMGMPSIKALHRELGRAGFRVCYYQVAPEIPFVERCEGVEVAPIRAGIPVKNALWSRAVNRIIGFPWYLISGYCKLIPKLKELKSSSDKFIIYGHTPRGAILASMVARRLGCKNISRFYGTLAPYALGLSKDYPVPWYRRLFGYIEHVEEIIALLVPAARWIVTDDGTHGDLLFEHVKGRASRDKLLFPRNGIDIDWESTLGADFNPVDWRSIFRNDAPVVLSAGRLIRWKRFDRIIDVVDVLRTRGVTVNVVILGAGSEEGPLLSMISSRELRNQVKIVTNVRHLDIARYFRSAAAILLMQDYTNVSNTLMESLALERPVIALDVGGTRSIIEPDKHAILVPLDGCVEKAADAVERILSDPEHAAELSRGAREWRDSKGYSWTVRASLDVDLIMSLLA